MARINIEDKWWNDPRRTALIRLVGDELIADGAMINVWRLAQDYWKRDKAGIPEHVFEHVRYGSELVRAGLVVLRDASVVVRGASEHFDWISKKRDSGRKGGVKSALARKAKYGNAQPASRNLSLLPKQTEASPSPSPSPSSSSSPSTSPSASSSIKSIRGNRILYSSDFETVWLTYERKGDKKASFYEYKKQGIQPEEAEDIVRAIKNYFLETPDPQFRKDCERFLKMDWREKLIPSTAQKFKPMTLHERNKKVVEDLLREQGLSDEELQTTFLEETK